MLSPADIHAAADRLRAGGVVAFPTETVYGLGADAFDEAAVRRVFELKGRPVNNPLIVHVSGPEMAKRVAREWSDVRGAEALARAFWPGPLSILVPRSLALPEIVTAGSNLVAVRCPNHPVALALLFELGSPMVGPSANLSGEVSPTTAAHVRASFAEQLVPVLDGGACEAGIESTVVDVTSDPPRVLRPGMVSAEQIAAVLGCEVDELNATAFGGPLHSPGLLDRHYAPRTPAHLFDAGDWPRIRRLFPSAVVLRHREQAGDGGFRTIEMPSDAAEYAGRLYAALREADALAAPVILIERPPIDTPLWRAIADRLRRATTALTESGRAT